jgi:hypothetical protein
VVSKQERIRLSERTKAGRLAAAQERAQKQVAKAQRKAEWEGKRLARKAKKNAPKKLPKKTQELLDGWNAAMEFVKGGGLQSEQIPEH